MIFDFRLRPPYGEFLGLSLFNPPCNTSAPQKYNARHTASAHARSLRLFFAEMDEAGISRGVVMGRATARKETSVSNECVHTLAMEYPERIVPFGCVELSQGIAAGLEELEKCIRFGFKGIAMEPGYFEPPCKADAACLYPVYARCEQVGLPVVLTLSFYQGPDLEFCNPTAVQHVATDFPGLQIVVAHACYPWLPHIFSIAAMFTNIWLIPDLYLLNPMTPGTEMYGNGIRWLDGERILFASAYPCYDLRQAVDDIERFNLTPGQKEKIMHRNAEQLLHL